MERLSDEFPEPDTSITPLLEVLREVVMMAEPMGFYTDTTVCIGCKACEVACKEWNQLPSTNGGQNTLSGDSYDNTRKLDGIHWRHVKFIEQFTEDRKDGRWLLMSDVCKHCVQRALSRSLPDRRDRAHRVRYGGHSIRRVQRLPRLYLGLPVRRHRYQPGLGHSRRSARFVMTACRCGMEPACSKACPTESIQFGTINDLKGRAQKARGPTPARRARSEPIFTAPMKKCLAGSTRFTCWWINRKSTACRPIRKCRRAI